jgi:hypothetical protein
MQGLWFRNMALNMSQILDGKDIKDLPRFDGKPCLVIGAGPSIRQFRQLEVLAKGGWKNPIICSDRMLIPLLKRKIKPNVAVTVDGESVVQKFFRHPLVEKFKGEVKAALCASTVHPDVVKCCPLEKYFFIALWDNPLNPTSLTRAFHLMTGKTMLETYGNAGSCAFSIAYYLGCDPIGLLGLDYSYYTNDVRKTTYYESLKALSGGNTAKLLSFYKRTKTWAGYEVLTDIYWLTYLEMFLPALEKAKAEIYNLSPLSIITSEKVRGMDLKKFLQKFNG